MKGDGGVPHMRTNSLHVGVLVLVLSVILSACAKPIPPTTEPNPTPARLDRFRVLTYNTLHGLEVGRFGVRPGEAKEERRERFKLQFQQLAQAQPDVMLLQEVNPLPEMADAYVDGLEGFGLQYGEVHQVDACGIRVGRLLTVAPGLNNGLVVLVKAPLRLRKLGGLKLSGGVGGCRDRIGLQTGELRYALIAEVENPATRRKILAVSLHLHSGIERDEYFIQKINQAREEGRLPNDNDLQEVQAALRDDQERRIQELRILLQELRKRQAEEDYVGAVIGGDFNFEPDSPEYRELEQAGLTDTHTIAGHERELYTYDPQQNPVAGHEEEALPTALSLAIKSLPQNEQEKVIGSYRKGLRQARRIDFLFIMTKPSATLKGCLKQELFGQPNAVPIRAGSDHYGVLDTFVLDPAQC